MEGLILKETFNQQHPNPGSFTKTWFLACLIFLIIFLSSGTVLASPWSSNEGYAAKTAGKFAFGLKNTLFSWLMPWVEAEQPQYKTEWEGFCVGISRAILYTANGLFHLATFPIPVDFPDFGKGTGLYEPPARGQYVDKPNAKASDKVETTEKTETSKPATTARPKKTPPSQKNQKRQESSSPESMSKQTAVAPVKSRSESKTSPIAPSSRRSRGNTVQPKVYDPVTPIAKSKYAKSPYVK